MSEIKVGQCLIWVDYDYPPEYSKNILWLKLNKDGTIDSFKIKINEQWVLLGIDDEIISKNRSMSSFKVQQMIGDLGVHVGDDTPLEKQSIWFLPSNKLINIRLNDQYIPFLSITQDISNGVFDYSILSALFVIDNLNLKVDKVNGKLLSDQNFELSEKDKLKNIESGALVNKNNIKITYIRDADDM